MSKDSRETLESAVVELLVSTGTSRETAISTLLQLTDSNALTKEIADLKLVLAEAQWLVKTLMPGVRHLFDVDYARLNTASIAVAQGKML